MIEDQQNGQLLDRTLSRLCPDIFSHPVWVHFGQPETPFSTTSIQALLQAVKQMRKDDDLRSACQVLLVCAVLQNRRGDLTAALNSAQQALSMAEAHALPQVARWAAWATSALYTSRGNYRQAAGQLQHLKTRLSANAEWVLANIVDLLSQTLLSEAPAGASGDTSPLDSVPPGSLLSNVLDWLLKWGAAPPAIEALHQDAGGVDRARRAPPAVAPVVRRFAAATRAAWRAAIRTARREFRPQALERREETPLRDPPPGPPAIAPRPPPARAVERPGSAADGSILTIYCLGPFRVYRGERPIDAWSSGKGKSIFKYLLTYRQAPTPKEVLMETFWPDAGPEAARRNLHQAIYALRQTLKTGQLDLQPVEFENDGYRLHPGLNLWLDCEEYERHIRLGRKYEQSHLLDRAIAEYGLAEGLYLGDFLAEDLYEDWTQAPRQHLWQAYLTVAHRLVEYYQNRNEHAATIALCQRILALDGCQEGAHQALMRCYLTQGQRHLAVSQYRRCVQALKAELDLAPSADTQTLYQKIVSA